MMTEDYSECPFCGYTLTAELIHKKRIPAYGYHDFLLAWKIKFGCSKCGRLMEVNLKDFNWKNNKATGIHGSLSHVIPGKKKR